MILVVDNRRLEEQSDGSLDLCLPVADLREIRLKVLQFGSEVEVFAPAELRADIAAEARRMLQCYGTDGRVGRLPANR